MRLLRWALSGAVVKMGLIKNITIAVIALVAIFAVAFYALHTTQSTQLTKQQAEQLVLNDLSQENPGANVSVVNGSPSTLEQNSWNIVVSVIYNATKPCPTLSIEGFDYPATGLVPSSYNIYTAYNRDTCIIYGLPNNRYSSYVINSPYIAIAKSFNESYSPIISYVYTYGYSNVNVHATLNRTTYVWLINYTAPNANYSLNILMHTNGSIIASS